MASILVVEDRPADRQFLTTLLAYRGYDVLEAHDGGRALDLLRVTRPDLVISDVLMPGIDGYELARRLRRIPHVATTPILLYSALYQDPGAVALAKECGVAQLLPKPSEPEAILAAIEAHLSVSLPMPAPFVKEPQPIDCRHARLLNEKLLEKVASLEEAERRLSAAANEKARLIADLRLQAAALSTNMERKQFAMAAARMGIWEFDLATERVTWSDTMAPVFGLTPDQAPTSLQEFLALIHPDDRAIIHASAKEALRGNAACEVEFRAVRPDGGTVWVAGRARLVLDENGRPECLLGVGIDITGRKSLEARLASETATRIKAEADIAYERLRVLKATMRTVQDIVLNSYQELQLIRFQAEDLVPESSLELFDEIIADASTKLRMLNDLDATPEKQMEMGIGIDYDRRRPGDVSERVFSGVTGQPLDAR